MKFLSQVQQDLEALYDLDDMPSVDDHLIDAGLAKAWLGEGFSSDQSQVLANFTDGEMHLGVYICQQTLDTLSSGAFANHAEMDAFCVLVEEVSHFLYLIWNAQNGMAVSLLDLELQGEIDKFLTAQRYLDLPEGSLLSFLFDAPLFRADLALQDQARYENANSLGRAIVQTLSAHDEAAEACEPWKDRRFLRDYYRQSSPRRVKYAAQQVKKNLVATDSE